MKKLFILSIFSFLSISYCAPSVYYKKVYKDNLPAKDKAHFIKIYKENKLPACSYDSIAVVEIHQNVIGGSQISVGKLFFLPVEHEIIFLGTNYPVTQPGQASWNKVEIPISGNQ